MLKARPPTPLDKRLRFGEGEKTLTQLKNSGWTVESGQSPHIGVHPTRDEVLRLDPFNPDASWTALQDAYIAHVASSRSGLAWTGRSRFVAGGRAVPPGAGRSAGGAAPRGAGAEPGDSGGGTWWSGGGPVALRMGIRPGLCPGPPRRRICAVSNVWGVGGSSGCRCCGRRCRRCGCGRRRSRMGCAAVG